MAIRDELTEELPTGKDPQKALAERIFAAEMDQHLAAEWAEEVAGDPRSRQASFEPQLITKYRRRFRIPTTRSSPSTPGI